MNEFALKEEIMRTCLVALLLSLSLFNQSVLAEGKSDTAIAGRWIYQQGNASSEMVLGANGAGNIDGVALAYQVRGDKLLVSMNGANISYHFQLKKNQLLLEGGDLKGVVQFMRAAQSATGKSSNTENSKRGNTKDEPLARLLVSGDWCSFSYSGGGGGSYGRSSTSRFHLSPDGSYSRSSNSESYSSNRNGSVAGQGRNGSGGHWQVRADVLYISEGNGPLNPAQLSVTRNSNGYPIIKSNGIEYMLCN